MNNKLFLEFKSDNDSFPSKPINLSYVNLNKDSRPVRGKSYELVPANDSHLETLKYPATEYCKLDIDLYQLYVDELPEFWSKKNEGLLKISANTLDPQDIDRNEIEASIARNFVCKNKSFAPSFLFSGLYRNILFKDWINIRIDLFELDKDSEEYFNRVKKVIDGVPEVNGLNIIKGIPYVGVATQLFESVIRVFGKNPDDHVWGEMPILELNPVIGGAFLRSGIYILHEKYNSNGEEIKTNDLNFKDLELKTTNSKSKKEMPTYLIFSLRLKPHKV